MDSSIEPHFEALQPRLTPEEDCLSALLELNDFQKFGQARAVTNFYAALTDEIPPDGLKTRISTHAVEQNPQNPPHFSPMKSYVEGYDIAATIIIDFEAYESGLRKMLNLDFVKTSEGLQLMQRKLFTLGESVVMKYSRIITEEELTALAQDAIAIKSTVIEEDAELMKLGPLVENPAEDGSRRFHIGDILSVTNNRLASPRGIEGIFDILGYMTSDTLYNTQIGRFMEECKPYLEQQLGETIESFAEVPETITDNVSLYKWLQSVTEAMSGDPFLKVDKISEKDHAVLDFMTELVLDYGPVIVEKMIQADPNIQEPDEE